MKEVIGSFDDRLLMAEKMKMNKDEKLMMSTEDKRGKRFLDPDDVLDHMEDHDHDHGNSTHSASTRVEGEAEEDPNLERSTADSDPHGEDQFCVDISLYMDLKWVLKDEEECHVELTSSLRPCNLEHVLSSCQLPVLTCILSSLVS